MRLVFSSVRTDSEPATVGGILQVSRRNNPRDGVTGALLSSRTRFVQLLEGDAAGLDRCFARIQRDARHRDIRVLLSGPTRELLFPEAPMLGIEAAGLDSPVAAALSDDAPPDRVMEILRALARRTDPQPAEVPEADASLVALRRIHRAARHILDDHLSRSEMPPDTLERLAASLTRQAAQAGDLHRRLSAASSADPDHRTEAQRFHELLQAAQREVGRRLGRLD
ncbi:hypothetical protein Rumeso_00269 [Rubellimicrobium mesophilum DSM 19309]|uniref:BLUF domain-containing protein n=2 Tax=Rubellimicrobium TaxID=295418 RepID=A0A017HVH1_9RHOB|nr:hypothetical protein Rumeso_00269 [Rubellimicrobium mesophilum DSM 19309]